ncbi:hypothetical protein TNCV_4177601 [Trichonephila clavipes]|nr:hypothetical protein TNCV_4177601 [Trichonephila clavipes]
MGRHELSLLPKGKVDICDSVRLMEAVAEPPNRDTKYGSRRKLVSGGEFNAYTFIDEKGHAMANTVRSNVREYLVYTCLRMVANNIRSP